MKDAFLIPKPLAEQIAGYLSQRPYREVAALMGGLAMLRLVEKSR